MLHARMLLDDAAATVSSEYPGGGPWYFLYQYAVSVQVKDKTTIVWESSETVSRAKYVAPRNSFKMK